MNKTKLILNYELDDRVQEPTSDIKLDCQTSTPTKHFLFPQSTLPIWI